MIAMDRRGLKHVAVAVATAAVLTCTTATAQQARSGRSAATQPSASQPGKAATLEKLNNTPQLKQVVVPVSPDDPVAIVNGQTISRRQLADECVARRGQEILETLIARLLIEQALKTKKMDVSAAEIDAEITRVARNMAGTTREGWLRTLEKDRGISPVQYARDIIYPALALRKLAAPQVQVTDDDMKDAFEAHFGEKLRIRMIMTDKLRAAQEAWEELKKNPGGFERIAQERSIDLSSRSLGGLVGEPITRHAYPRNVSDAAFQQLVDGDPKDKDPSHKPKDGDFTGPIQVTEGSWVIIRRENVIAAQKVNRDDPVTRKMIHDMMYEAKLKQKMTDVYGDLQRQAAIDNKLTGQVKLANEDLRPEHQVDNNVQLMSNSGGNGSSKAQAKDDDAGAPGKVVATPPAGVPADQLKKIDALKRPLRTSAPATESK